MEIKFSEADYNKGFQEFDNAEVYTRAEDIIKTTTGLVKEFKGNETKASGMLAAGKINEIEGDYPFAIRWYERAIALDPNLHEAYARLALVQLKNGQHEDGLHTATKLVSIAPNLVFPANIRRRPLSAWTVLGDALRLNGSKEAARDAYGRAITVEPRDMFASGHLGVLLIEEGNLDEGIQHLENVDQANGIFGPILSTVRLAENDPDILLSVRKTFRMPVGSSVG